MKYIILTLKSAVIGATMLVPGVSGGTMAMMLGIYQGIIRALGALKSKKNLVIMALFLAGGALGMFLFARPLSHLLERFPMPVMYFFTGAVAGGVPLIVKKARITRFSPALCIYPVLGALVIWGISLIPEGLLSSANGGIFGILLLFASGLVAALALILPGISVSYMLLLLGVYEQVMQALTTFSFGSLMPLLIGILAGVVLFAKCLDFVMERHPKPTYLIILGFILASCVEIFPGIPTGIHIVTCIIALLAGFFALFFLSKWNAEDGDTL